MKKLRDTTIADAVSATTAVCGLFFCFAAVAADAATAACSADAATTAACGLSFCFAAAADAATDADANPDFKA